MVLTELQKIEITEKIVRFIKGGGLLKDDCFPVLLKIENDEITKTEDRFLSRLEEEVFRCTGKTPQWIVGGIEDRKLWIGMTVSLSHIPNDSLTLHGRDYHFVVVV